ncbi:hypothetical protein Y1Q_0008048 [Alligator mississippiensis]|uniref:Uncharacterized protein n=1 Tax=Alligator mississippiensis TaxID=8496 RepID=A0A151NFA8_ALLMI|nr:hypothetical protein Y1Q_0008048 [Alligator mississippiensis]
MGGCTSAPSFHPPPVGQTLQQEQECRTKFPVRLGNADPSPLQLDCIGSQNQRKIATAVAAVPNLCLMGP